MARIPCHKIDDSMDLLASKHDSVKCKDKIMFNDINGLEDYFIKGMFWSPVCIAGESNVLS